MMTARDDTSTRPRKFNIMALLLAGSALGIAGCAQQRTEGYYDPPAESTVTDAQSQGSGAGYRTVLRAPSQVQIALKPDAPARPRASRPRPRKHTTEDGQPVPEGGQRRASPRRLGRGARAGPPIHARAAADRRAGQATTAVPERRRQRLDGQLSCPAAAPTPSGGPARSGPGDPC